MSGAAHPPPPPAPGPVAAIAIDDRGFSPGAAVVAPGTVVRWSNAGRNRHTVTAADGRFDSGALGFGADFTIAAPASGSVDYLCSFHAFMRGSITVSDLSLSGPATVRIGRRATVAGTVPGAGAGAAVAIERRVRGAWRAEATTVTAADGSYTARVGPLRSGAALRAVAGERVSPALRVAVAPLLRVRRSGARVVLSAGRRSAAAPVRLERLDLDTYRWRRAADGRLSPVGRLSVRLAEAGVYRFVVGAAGALAGATSRPIVHLPYRLRVP